MFCLLCHFLWVRIKQTESSIVAKVFNKVYSSHIIPDNNRLTIITVKCNTLIVPNVKKWIIYERK